MYLAGQKLKFKDSILDHLSLGEKLSCDMVRKKSSKVFYSIVILVTGFSQLCFR